MPYLLCYYCGNVCCYNYNISSLAFVRSGWTNVSTEYEGAMRYVGENGYYWAHTSVSSVIAYDLVMGPTHVYTSNYNYRYFGLSLRCRTSSFLH